MENRLNSFGNVRGWVFGAWGETSQEAHTLVQKLGEAIVRLVDILPGQSLISKSKAAQLASEVGFLRRRLSFAAVQGHSYIKPCISVLGRGLAEFKQIIWFQLSHLSSPIISLI